MAGLEPRFDLILNNPLGGDIGQGTFEAVTNLYVHLPILYEHEEHGPDQQKDAVRGHGGLLERRKSVLGHCQPSVWIMGWYVVAWPDPASRATA